MKTHRKILYLWIILASFSIWSCEEYLEKTEKADLLEEDVFKTFQNFQGYVETMYDDVINVVLTYQSGGDFNFGDDIIPKRYRGFIEGDYLYVTRNDQWYFYQSNAVRSSGTWTNAANRRHAVWQNGWFGIRAANITFSHLKDLVEATDEQRQLIEGQAYFFRGYFHWEIMRAYGSIPFIDTVISPSSEMKYPQLGLYVLAEKIIKDLQKAADLLPENWDFTETGKLTQGKNIGRATKGMALANMAEVMLWCGSPLFHGVETGNYIYNVDYCKKAADVSWQIIQLANKGIYALEPWATFRNNFVKHDNTFPVTNEIIFNSPSRGECSQFTNTMNYVNGGVNSPTQNYVELFEMANGLPIEDPASGHDLMNPWVNRDPRLRFNVVIDRDRIITSLNDARAFAEFYIGGRERSSTQSLTGFGWGKYWDATINNFDKGWTRYWYNPPRIRLAEVYLWYAEAVNEAYGPTGTVPGSTLTAVAAVDIVRARAGMPGVNAKFLGSKEAFRERIWNERAVEICWENERWYDLRRWHVSHLPKYRELYELQFDKNYTYFNRVLSRTIEFSERHYFLPFATNQVNLYPGWKQNPGW